MSDDELVSSALDTLFSSPNLSPPVSSFQLLTSFITLTNKRPLFRLTDLSRFESILENLSHSWQHGSIVLSRQPPDNTLYVMDVTLQAATGLCSSPLDQYSRKRKRIIDEDADSAAGGDDAEEISSFEDTFMASTILGGLSKDLREVYSILQKGTARGRLLAEQVRLSWF
jgi:mRNA m6A methyltransferase catalytic subunit